MIIYVYIYTVYVYIYIYIYTVYVYIYILCTYIYIYVCAINPSCCSDKPAGYLGDPRCGNPTQTESGIEKTVVSGLKSPAPVSQHNRNRP